MIANFKIPRAVVPEYLKKYWDKAQGNLIVEYDPATKRIYKSNESILLDDAAELGYVTKKVYPDIYNHVEFFVK